MVNWDAPGNIGTTNAGKWRRNAACEPRSPSRRCGQFGNSYSLQVVRADEASSRGANATFYAGNDMSVQLDCTCGKSYRLKREVAAGRTIRCPACGNGL